MELTMWSVMLADFTGGAQYPLRLYGHCMDRILNIKHISTLCQASIIRTLSRGMNPMNQHW